MIAAHSFAVLVLFSAAAGAQPAAALRFESASIRFVPDSDKIPFADHFRDASKAIDLMAGKRLSDGTLNLGSVSMRTLLMLAFPTEKVEDRFLEPRRWIGKPPLELIAKAPPGTPADDVRMMIQTLLVERLHLAVHREPKKLEVATLIIAKGGVKLRPAAGSADAQCEKQEDNGIHQWTCENVTMKFLARMLAVLERTGIDNLYDDATGLDGSYDLSFKWVPPNVSLGDAGDRVKALSYGLKKALGLKLETRRQSVPVVVVDHLDSL